MSSPARSLGPLWVLVMIGLWNLTAALPAGAARADRGAAAPETAAPETAAPRLVLKDISTLLYPGGTLSVTVDTRTPPPADLDLVINVYRPVRSRSEFDLIADGTLPPQADTHPYALSSLPRSPSGWVVSIPVASLLLHQEGVYPLAVSLRAPDFSEVDRLITFFVFFSEPRNPPPFRVSFVVPVQAPAAEETNGTISPAAADALRSHLDPIAALVKTAGALRFPLTLPIRPVTLEEWSRVPATPGTSVTDLAQPSMEYVADSYTGLSASVLSEGQLEPHISDDLARGRSSLLVRGLTPTVGLGVAPAPPYGSRSVSRLVAAGATALVIDESAMAPVDLQFTLTRPFDLDLQPVTDTLPVAVAPDAPLSGILGRPTDQPRADAARVFAELTQLYLDRPGDPRGAVLELPPGASADLRVLEPLFRNILASGYLRASTLSQIFMLPLARDGADAQRELHRTLTTRDPPLPLDASGFLDAGARIDSLERVEGDLPSVKLARRLLALSEGSNGDPGVWLAGIQKIIQAELAKVHLVASRSVTLAAPDGVIPLTIQNTSSEALTVTIVFSADRLRFPAGNRSLVSLPPRTQTINTPVEALTTGSFPVEVTITSPCDAGSCPGLLLISPVTRLTVTSTKASVVGIALAGGALLFLLSWWTRQFVLARRRRRLNLRTANADSAGK
jgi:hypothetical protein